jgi:Raf kinase inhibitor-like YbhB/YbcL family protein
VSLAALVLAAALDAAQPASMTLTSRDLTAGAPMPREYAYAQCGGANVSPELSWTGSPEATKGFVVTMIDLDVAPGGWSHWIVENVPAQVASLPRGVVVASIGARGVVSDFGDAVYDGPCPPAGTGVHHYELTVWAMANAKEDMPAEPSAQALRARLAATSLAHASLVVTAEGR